MKSRALALLVLAVFVSVGCGSRRGGSTATILGDGGSDARTNNPGDPDGGEDVDAGIIIDFDMGGRDLGTTPVVDAGRDLGTVGFDAGRDMGTTVECPSDVLTPIDSAAYCSASTSECASACADNTCFFDCIEADSNPDCGVCVNYVSLRCYNSVGCQDAWDTYSCCASTNCPEGSAEGCAAAACPTEQAAYSACIESLSDISACGAFLDPCFGF